MARTLIFQEQELSFVTDINNGYSVSSLDTLPFVFVEGDKYTVIWDDETYVRTAFSYTDDGSNCVAIGNPKVAGLESNEDKFAIVCDTTNSCLQFFAYDLVVSHTVTVYHGVEDDIDYLIKGSTLTSIANAIRGKTNKSDTIPVTSMADEIGSIATETVLEDLPISLDFSAGDMEIVAPDGTLVKSAIIQKPAYLTPAYIAEGIDIAGVVGTLAAAGSSSIKIATGTFTVASNNTITHDLGVVPDFIMIYPASGSSSTTTYTIAAMFGFSTAFKAAYSWAPGIAYACTMGSSSRMEFKTYSRCIDKTYDSGYPNVIRDTNETTFIVNRASTVAPAIPFGVTMRWVAIGGLV